MASDKPAPKPSPPNAAPKPHKPRMSKRENFTSKHVRRVINARRAIRNLAKCGNTVYNEYSADEAANIVKLIKDEAADLERAFKGVPKEKGLYDL